MCYAIKMTEKVCTRCKISKPVSAFAKNTQAKGGIHPSCKECVNAWARQNRVTNPDAGRRAKLKMLYGMDIAHYWMLLANQEDRCAICRTSEPGGRGSFHVDHDHATGKIRGLLCANCNRGLGYLKSDPERLMAATGYVLAWHDVLAAGGDS